MGSASDASPRPARSMRAAALKSVASTTRPSVRSSCTGVQRRAVGMAAYHQQAQVRVGLGRGHAEQALAQAGPQHIT
jgi:hypothetical protein